MVYHHFEASATTLGQFDDYFETLIIRHNIFSVPVVNLLMSVGTASSISASA